MKHRLRSLLLGLATGDALGVPYEFLPRSTTDSAPCTGMRGYGTHQQPPGTWSDDTSMALVLIESLAKGDSLERLAQGFVRWLFHAEWTPWGHVFDFGGATAQALDRVAQGCDPRHSGGTAESSNGNGSLMRTAPLAWFVRHEDEESRRSRSFEVSAITHAHPCSLLGCWLCVEVCVGLLNRQPLPIAVDTAWLRVDAWASGHPVFASDWKRYRRCRSVIQVLPRESIESSGYVVHTLEAALWCLLTSGTYEETVLKAVNLGSDTDTTGAVAGALAGLLYGEESIPQEWIESLARRDELERLVDLDLE